MRARPRPLSVFAGLLAMLGSLTAMSAVIISDVASAEPVTLSDVAEPASPVKVQKIDHRPELERQAREEALIDALEAADFGAFEGY